jgi:hypothetical protein
LTYREQLPPIVADELDQLLTRLNARLVTTDTDVSAELTSLSSHVSSLQSQVSAITTGVELLVRKGAPSGYAGLTSSAVVAPSTGGTGTGVTFTEGSVVFAGPVGVYAQNTANVFWDDANIRLGIGTALPSAQLHTTGSVRHAVFGVGVATFSATGVMASTAVLPVTLGGTGLATVVTGDLLYASATDTLSRLADVAAGSFLRSGGVTTAPVWSTTTWPNAATQGDLVYASAASTFVVLAKDTNATRYLSNTGATNNPAWAQVALATGVSGVLPIANGGTNSSTALSGSTVMISDGSKIIQGAAGTTTTVLHGNAAGAPTYAAVSLTAEVSGDLPFANLAQGSALSILGVTGNAIADVASIVAASDFQVLRRSGTAVAFGAVDVAQSAAITGILPLTNGGTGGSTVFTEGSVIYAGASGVLAQNNAVFKWNNSSSTLTVNGRITGRGATADSSEYVLVFENSTPANLVFIRNDGLVQFSTYGAGTATFDANGNISSVSDERLKRGIAPWTRGLDFVKAIETISHRWGPTSGLEQQHTYVGFRAQQIRAIAPELVFARTDGELSLWDRGILAGVVNAVKTLDERVAALEARVVS